jgi:acetolactate synthase-1/2/3 large subunit
MTSVAELVIEALRASQITQLFCLPGVQNDEFFDALHDASDITPIVTRHEQGAAYMAMGAAQATGRPAAFCVVPGPGMLNASAAMTSAYWGCARVLAVIGQIHTSAMGQHRGALHELPDQTAILRQLTKHAVLIDNAETAAADIQAAVDAVFSDVPRPVSIEVPVDMWSQKTDIGITEPTVSMPQADAATINAAVHAIGQAVRPLIVVGSGAYEASDEVRHLADVMNAPVTTRRMGHGVVPTTSERFVSLPVARELWAEADLIVGIGTRLEFPLSHWGTTGINVVQINIDPDEIDRYGLGAIGVVGDAADVCRDLSAELVSSGHIGPDQSSTIATHRAKVDLAMQVLEPQAALLRAIRSALPDDGVIVEDVTQLGFAAHLLYPHLGPRTFLSSGPAGTLGAGFAVAIGAQAALPNQNVLAICGDGGFMFTATELATAVRYNIPVTVLVSNDGAFGNVKRIQTDRFGADRTIASDLTNPDFVAFAESFGAHAVRAETPDELEAALRESFAHDGPSLVELMVGPLPNPWPFLRMGEVR